MQTLIAHRQYMKEWYKTHKTSVILSRKKAYEKRRNFLNQVKQKPCADCGDWFHPWQMQFDHREPEQKIFNIANCKAAVFKTLWEEIKKCDIVCANCHAHRTYKRIHL